METVSPEQALAAAVAIALEIPPARPMPSGDALAAIVADVKAGAGRRDIMVRYGIGFFHANKIVEMVRPVYREPDLLSLTGGT